MVLTDDHRERSQTGTLAILQSVGIHAFLWGGL